MQTLLRSTAHLAAVMMLLLHPAPTAAQSARGQTVTSWTDPAIATLLLVDSLGAPDARAIVIRRPGDLPNNIILVTRETQPAELATAVAAIIASRRARGDRVDREMRTIVRAVDMKKRKSSPDDSRARSDLHRLQLAPTFEIAGIGRGPALVIRMADSATVRKTRERQQ